VLPEDGPAGCGLAPEFIQGTPARFGRVAFTGLPPEFPETMVVNAEVVSDLVDKGAAHLLGSGRPSSAAATRSSSRPGSVSIMNLFSDGGTRLALQRAAAAKPSATIRAGPTRA
jgi:hypothetical protein